MMETHVFTIISVVSLAYEVPIWAYGTVLGIRVSLPLLSGFWDMNELLHCASRTTLAFMGGAIALRIALAGATLLHEWAHLLAALFLLPREKACRLLTAENMRGNVSVANWLASIWPTRPLPPGLQPFVDISPGAADRRGKCGVQELESSSSCTGTHSASKQREGAELTAAGCCVGDHKLIQISGWLASATLACWATFALPSTSDGPFRLQEANTFWADVVTSNWALGAWLCLLAATVTDLLPLLQGSTRQRGAARFMCGNFGLLLAGSISTLRGKAMDALSVLEAMAAVSTERGGQSGGLVTLLPGNGGQVRGLRVRVCPGKRESLSEKLASRFRWREFTAGLRLRLWSLLTFWRRRPGGSSGGAGGEGGARAGMVAVPPQVFAGHTRFATSSIPSDTETHPHQWTPEHQSLFWGPGGGAGAPRVSATWQNVGLYITHNGDFEFWNLFGRDRTHSELGPWLQTVLDAQQPATCDSVMIAGLLELLRTQGLWLHSLRLAFYQTVVMSFEEVISGAAAGAVDPQDVTPSKAAFQKLAAVVDGCMQAFVAELPRQLPGAGGGPGSMRDALGEEGVQGLTQAVLEALEAHRGAAAPGARTGGVLASMSSQLLDLYVHQAVTNFLDNDLYFAVNKFLASAKGSFGMSACCTLEPATAVLAALNQPLSVGFAASLGAVLYSSEAHALKVPLRLRGGRQQSSMGKEKPPPSSSSSSPSAGHIDFRLDLNEADGEILELRLEEARALPPLLVGAGGGGEGSCRGMSRNAVAGEIDNVGPPPLDVEAGHTLAPDVGGAFHLPGLPYVQLRMHNLRHSCALHKDDLVGSGRLVSMAANPYVTFYPPRPAGDLVAHDIHDVPRVLGVIRSDWADEAGLNRQSARALYEMLLAKALSIAKDPTATGSNRKEIDVLITGVESSLWVGEQFAADLQNCFPKLRVVPISANKVIGVMGNARGAISTTGFSFCRLTSSLSNTIVISISQSGQTFPTLHATRILTRQCPGRVFVLVGMMDSKMAATVGQSMDAAAPFCRRIFCTNAGWRSSEAATLTAVAAHATLTELTLLLARQLRAAPGLASSPLGLRLSARDVADLDRMRDAFVESTACDIVGVDEDGKCKPSPVHSGLAAQGYQWGLHIVETPIAWALSALYIFVTVVLGVPVFTDIRRALGLGGTEEKVVAYVAHAFDALLYCFLPLVFSLLLRLLQGRQLWARLGKRTLVIADVPYVHQLLEVYVSKMFALSYSIASIDVHGANPIDHFVHRFTHRVTRGVLLAVGRPDGRLCSQTKCESWVLMALLQARSIVNLGAAAEAVTIGHNPHTTSLIKNHLVLPSNRPKFLCEKLLGVDDFEPLKRMASRQHAVTAGKGHNAFDELDSQVVGLHLCAEGSVQRARRLGLSMLAHGTSEIVEAESDNPATRNAILSALELDVQRLLDSQSPLEELCENRFLSLERLLAFQVMFHKMAGTVAGLWPLSFAIWRSQSCLRIATTAAPVSAADLEREWLESSNDPSLDATVHRRPSRGGGGSSSSFTRLSDALSIVIPQGSSMHGHSRSKSPGGSLHDRSHRGGGGSGGGAVSPGHSLHQRLAGALLPRTPGAAGAAAPGPNAAAAAAGAGVSAGGAEGAAQLGLNRARSTGALQRGASEGDLNSLEGSHRGHWRPAPGRALDMPPGGSLRGGLAGLSSLGASSSMLLSTLLEGPPDDAHLANPGSAARSPAPVLEWGSLAPSQEGLYKQASTQQKSAPEPGGSGKDVDSIV